jgi:hypothetical protein
MKRLFAVLLSLLVALPAAYAQERKSFPQAELDQMLAPVALYPDPLLSQVLMASTYPLEIVEAARWSRANPGLKGDEAVRAVAEKDWDPSVKSMLAFPDLLARMDEQLDWTRRLGDAFLAQETQVMDTVQQLRKRAQNSGNLAPDERQSVVAEGDTIAIEPADPRVVYVPYYDPHVVYGPWWWSAYPPVVWAPWPGYAVAQPGFWWGVGIGITTGFFYGGVDWHHGHVKVVHANNYYVKPAYHQQHAYGHKPVQPGKWQHDTSHRRGVGQRYDQRRAEHRGQPMPPAFRTASQQQHQQPRFDRRDERRGDARPDHRPQQPRADKPQHWPQHGQQPRADKPQHGPQHGQQPRADKPQHGPQHGSQPRADKPQHGPQHGSQPRVQAPQRGPQPRMEAPQRSQPRMEVHRPQSQPRMESRGGGGQPRMETRGGGGFGGGARGGDHGGRGGGRG